jgi:tetratricopeptide (TPR) repeat protein
MTVRYLEGQKEKLNYFIKNTQYESALKVAKDILVSDESDSTSYQIVGKIYSLLNSPIQAIENFIRAIELNPKCNLNYISISQSFSAIGENEKGISYLKKGIKVVGNDPLIFYNLGIIYQNNQNWDQAEVNFLKAIKLKPFFPDALNNLGNVYYKKMDYERSAHYLKRSIKQNNNSSMAFHNLANTQRSMGMYKEAIIFYKNALEIKPEQIESINALGLTYYDVFENKSGIECFKSILEMDKKNYSAKRNLAIGYVKTGYFKKAIKLFRETLEKLPNCIISINNLIQLSSYEKTVDINNLFNKLQKILQSEELSLEHNKTQIVTLLGFGRSGSLFLHSLLDGHPQISTLPGYFFKGWFSEKTWPIFQPNFEEINWRETLVEKICTYFEPQFNANCKKNVIGKPNHHTEWFAQNLGFTQLGENHSEVLELDQQKFKSKFIDLSQAYDKIDSRICFELIHQAFDKAYRIPENSSQKDKIIFYHLHNPSDFEHANFNYQYPDGKSLFIIRHPIQMLESWLLTDLTSLPSLLEENHTFNDNYHFIKILNCGAKISYSLGYFLNPFNSMENVRGIKLEDLKRNTEKTLRKISEWMGIKYNPLLYQSTFMEKHFSRPSANFNNIEGFDTRSIDVSLGRIFGKKDIEVLETLFWPFMDMYGYTKMSKEQFLHNLKEIKPHLDKPFQFEEYIYKKLPEDKPDISKINQFNELHRELKSIWEILDETKTYPNLIKPLVI